MGAGRPSDRDPRESAVDRGMTSMGGEQAAFPLTRWTLIAHLHQADSGRAEVLRDLAHAYWKPLYAYLHRKGVDDADAKDSVQGFFASLLERDALAAFDPARGRFRTYLLTVFLSHRRDAGDRDRAQKRSPREAILSLDREETGRQIDPAGGGDSPEEAYLRAWAKTKLDRAVGCVRAGLQSRDDRATIAVLDDYLTADDPARPGYARMAERSGLSETGVRHALERLRRLLRDALLAEVRTETSCESEAQEELGLIFEALARASSG